MRTHNLFLILSVLLVAGCGGTEEPEGTPVQFGGSGVPESAQKQLEFESPEGWIAETPASTMRVAQYRLPGEGSEDAEVAVFTFPGTGGSVDANIQRWIGQFSEADRENAAVTRKTVNDLPVTYLDISGTYTPGMMDGDSTRPQPDYRVLAAVIETPTDPWFVKLTGPSATVDQWEESFYQYVDSVRSES